MYLANFLDSEDKEDLCVSSFYLRLQLRCGRRVSISQLQGSLSRYQSDSYYMDVRTQEKADVRMTQLMEEFSKRPLKGLFLNADNNVIMKKLFSPTLQIVIRPL